MNQIRISDQQNMISASPTVEGLYNNTAHNKLWDRDCFLGKLLKSQKDLEVPTEFKLASAFTTFGLVPGSHSIIKDDIELSLNLWTLLVGPSASRKSSSIAPYQNLMNCREDFFHLVFPENVTTAAIRKYFQESYEISNDTFEEKYARSIGIFYIQELHDFINLKENPKDGSFWTNMWGDQEIARISRLGDGDFLIKRPTINILAAVQTKRLLDVVPLTAWRQGFFPRMIPVYSDRTWETVKIKKDFDFEEGTVIDIKSDPDLEVTSYKNCLLSFNEDMDILSRSSYICGFDKETKEMFNELVLPKVPTQMKEYADRRSEHFRKIAALCSISRFYKGEVNQNTVVKIKKEDFEIAYDFLAYNDSCLHKMLEEAIKAPNQELFSALDEFVEKNEGEINEQQLRGFCTKHGSISQSKRLMQNILEVEYLVPKPKNRDKFIKNTEFES